MSLPSRGPECDARASRARAPSRLPPGRRRAASPPRDRRDARARAGRCPASRNAAQGDREQRVVDRSRRSRGPGESPAEHEALAGHEPDDLALEAADVDAGGRMPDAAAAADVSFDLCPLDREAARSEPPSQEIGIQPRPVDLVRRGGNDPFESDHRRAVTLSGSSGRSLLLADGRQKLLERVEPRVPEALVEAQPRVRGCQGSRGQPADVAASFDATRTRPARSSTADVLGSRLERHGERLGELPDRELLEASLPSIARRARLSFSLPRSRLGRYSPPRENGGG